MASKFLRFLLLLVVLGALGYGGYYAKKNYLDPKSAGTDTLVGTTGKTVPTGNGGSGTAGGSGGIPAVDGVAVGTPVPTPKAGLVDDPDFDASTANIQARKDVLARINRMPHLTDDQRAKLVNSVGRARNMGCIFIIPFQNGQKEIGAKETDILVSGFKSSAIQQLMKDPTVVFVVLGYADKLGDAATNEKVSTERTQSVLNAMKDRCGVVNVTYGVGMGGSDMFDGKSAAKNRLVEIWAAFP